MKKYAIFTFQIINLKNTEHTIDTEQLPTIITFFANG